MSWVAEVFRRVRWADGRLVSHRQDGVALGIHLLSMSLLIAGLISTAAASSPVPWWALLLVTLVLECIAMWRLRRAVRRIEALGEQGQDQIKPHITDITDQIRIWTKRCDDFVARQNNQEWDKQLARAEAAKARGDQKSAAKYLRRAEFVRKCERWTARAIEKYESRRL